MFQMVLVNGMKPNRSQKSSNFDTDLLVFVPIISFILLVRPTDNVPDKAMLIDNAFKNLAK